VRRAALAVTADDRCTVWLNGQEIGTHTDWHAARRFDLPGGALHPGRNVLAVRAENVKANMAKNPAGLIAGLSIELAGGGTQLITADAKWRSSKEAADGWQQVAFDDSGWPAAKIAAPRGGGPWGNVGVGASTPYDVPQAFGTNEVRVIYVPAGRSITLQKIAAGTRVVGFYFDPVTGMRTPTDTTTLPRVEPPPLEAGGGHDWVLVVQTTK
jgi:hypothetical protein